jgi:hypothetical protein
VAASDEGDGSSARDRESAWSSRRDAQTRTADTGCRRYCCSVRSPTGARNAAATAASAGKLIMNDGRVPQMRLLNCVLFNARSLRNKIRDLEAMCKDLMYDVIAVTETWFCRDDLALLNPITKLYDFASFEREHRGGGGVLLLVRKGIEVRHLPDLAGDCECAWFELVCMQHSVRIGVFYRAPDAGDVTLEAMEDVLSRGIAFPGSSVVVGDFNFPGISWFGADNVTGSSAMERRFVALCEQLSLDQLVSEPTHDGGNTLDLVLCDNVAAITKLEVVGKFSARCDHGMIEFCVTCDPRGDEQPVLGSKPNFTAWDPAAASQALGATPIDFSNCGNADDLWSVFETRSEEVIGRFVPKVRQGNARRFQWPYQIRRASNLQRKLWKDYKASGRADLAIKVRHREVSKSIRSMKHAHLHERETAVLLSGSSKRFFGYVNGRLSTHAAIPNLRREDGTWAATAAEKAELLAAQFGSTYTADDGNIPEVTQHSDTIIDSVDFPVAKIASVLDGLKGDLCSGPDGLPRIFYKKLTQTLAPILWFLFTALLALGSVPSSWLIANVTALYKGKGSRFDPGNYRDISLTSVASKCMETIVRDALIKHLTDIGLLSPYQHGFLPGRSTLTQMLQCMNDWTRTLGKRQAVDIMYLDFAKAFNSVSHRKLLRKLHALGVRGKLLRWIQAFLSNRRQRVRVNNCFSDWRDLPSGVPQGSVLGPILFAIYVNDLPGAVQSSSVRLYADDSKLYFSVNGSTDAAAFQEDLSRVFAWANEWQLTLALHKCAVLHCGFNNQRFEYTIADQPVAKVSSYCDLGITVTPDLKPSEHCRSVAKKAFTRVNLILKSFFVKDPRFLMRLFNVFVRPKLESNTPVWNPGYIRDIDALERVQRNYTSRIPGFRLPWNYEERLITLNQDSLELRRWMFDMCLVYKILNGLIELKVEDFFQRDPNAARSRTSHSQKLMRTVEYTVVRSSFFSNRVIAVWNGLPEEVVVAPSMNAFKHRLCACKPYLMSFSRTTLLPRSFDIDDH